MTPTRSDLAFVAQADPMPTHSVIKSEKLAFLRNDICQFSSRGVQSSINVYRQVSPVGSVVIK